MDKELQQKALEEFRDYVIKHSQSNLQRKKSTGNLSKSLSAEVKVMPNSIRFFFEMEEYGFYQDKGVRGKNPNALPINSKNHGIQKAPNSPFKFGSGSGNKGGLRRSLDKWIIRKGIAPRDKGGKFMSRNTLKFLMARSIYFSGIKPSLWFTKPFEEAFNNLPTELIDAYGLESEELFDTIMKENFNSYADK